MTVSNDTRQSLLGHFDVVVLHPFVKDVVEENPTDSGLQDFVFSFVLILVIDLGLNIILDSIFQSIWPHGGNKLF